MVRFASADWVLQRGFIKAPLLIPGIEFSRILSVEPVGVWSDARLWYNPECSVSCFYDDVVCLVG